MTPEPHIESILHLSALALIVSIAYLGLDRVHHERDLFLEGLMHAREKAQKLVLRYDVKPGEAPDKNSMFYRFPFFLRLKFFALCRIADVHGKIEMGFWCRVSHWIHRQLHVPGLGYFRSRHDRIWVSGFATIALVIFLFMTAAALWKLKHFPTDLLWYLRWIETHQLLTPAYWVCLVVLVWIFASVGVTHFLRGIEGRCDRLQEQIDDHMKKIADDVMRSTLRRS